MKIIASIPTARAFFDLMNEIETFQNEHTDRLNGEQYESLSENQLNNLAFRLDEAEQELSYQRTQLALNILPVEKQRFKPT